jgi:hypothetical protein
MGWTDPRLHVQIGRQGLARGEELVASLRLTQISSKTTRTVRDHETDLTGRLPIRSTSLLDDP